MFSSKDIKQIEAKGIDLSTINSQMDKFKTGFPSTILVEAAIQGNGLLIPDENEVINFSNYYTENKGNYSMVKFVPASGAATRMFKSLFSFLTDYSGSKGDYEALIADQSSGSVYSFLKDLEKFAFYEDLKAKHFELTGESLEEAQLKKKYTSIIETLLLDKGLGYGSLPKGLLKFHKYKESIRTPVEEHMVEGADYAADEKKRVALHFTVSPEHLAKFKSHVNEVVPVYEALFDVKFNIGYSIQKVSTDTIAVDMENNPFRNEDGSILFRPAGHGALVENLNDLKADIVFIKNIDNVVPDRLKHETLKFKKVIAGVLLYFREKIIREVREIQSGKGLESSLALLKDHLGFQPAKSFEQLSDELKIDLIKSKLNRPIRVCGVVQSEGDPGGGPFWVKDEEGSLSLQIVETAQMNLNDPEQKEVFNQVTHFNPVDVVAFLKDVNGDKFDLMRFRDSNTGFITKKSKDGQDLKAQELPGLWNGSMADWNTIFVAVPSITFNPVKSVNDLLQGVHQGG